MIAITGANGNLGKAVLSFLLHKTQAANIIAIVRDPQKMAEFAGLGLQIRRGDYTDPESLDAALEGVNELLQISSAEYGPDAAAEEQNVVTAAVRQGVRRVVYTSSLHVSDNPVFWGAQTCKRTEEAIRRSGMQYSFFRNSMYMETIPLFIGNAMEDGQIYFPAGEGAISFVSRMDIAEAISTVLLRDDQGNHIYEITGEKAFAFSDIAQALQKVKGVPCSYTDIPGEVLMEEMRKAGLPEQECAFYLNMGESIKAGEFQWTDRGLEELLGRKRQAVDEYLAVVLRPEAVGAH